MAPIEFKSAQVERVGEDDGAISIALFDGEPQPQCVALLRCTTEAARALNSRLGFLLERRAS